MTVCQVAEQESRKKLVSIMKGMQPGWLVDHGWGKAPICITVV